VIGCWSSFRHAHRQASTHAAVWTLRDSLRHNISRIQGKILIFVFCIWEYVYVDSLSSKKLVPWVQIARILSRHLVHSQPALSDKEPSKKRMEKHLEIQKQIPKTPKLYPKNDHLYINYSSCITFNSWRKLFFSYASMKNKKNRQFLI